MNKLILRNINNPVVMAILNATPDSFFASSRWPGESKFRERVCDVLNQGAKMIDVGGYSTRPGAANVDADEEFKRVDQAVRIIREVSDSVIISVDTFRSSVVERLVNKFGQIVVNDISAGETDCNMLKVVAQNKLPYIAMHMRGNPQTMQSMCEYENVVDDVCDYFRNKIVELENCGIEDYAIDPGFGFSKTLEQNYELLGGVAKLTRLGAPVLVGVSRKSMIYKALDTTADQSLAGTIALGWEALRQGAMRLRVHDVKEAADTVRLWNIYQNNR